jgi:hypothetical protein
MTGFDPVRRWKSTIRRKVYPCSGRMTIEIGDFSERSSETARFRAMPLRLGFSSLPGD